MISKKYKKLQKEILRNLTLLFLLRILTLENYHKINFSAFQTFISNLHSIFKFKEVDDVRGANETSLKEKIEKWQ